MDSTNPSRAADQPYSCRWTQRILVDPLWSESNTELAYGHRYHLCSVRRIPVIPLDPLLPHQNLGVGLKVMKKYIHIPVECNKRRTGDVFEYDIPVSCFTQEATVNGVTPMRRRKNKHNNRCSNHGTLPLNKHTLTGAREGKSVSTVVDSLLKEGICTGGRYSRGTPSLKHSSLVAETQVSKI